MVEAASACDSQRRRSCTLGRTPPKPAREGSRSDRGDACGVGRDMSNKNARRTWFAHARHPRDSSQLSGPDLNHRSAPHYGNGSVVTTVGPTINGADRYGVQLPRAYPYQADDVRVDEAAVVPGLLNGVTTQGRFACTPAGTRTVRSLNTLYHSSDVLSDLASLRWCPGAVGSRFARMNTIVNGHCSKACSAQGSEAR